MRAAVFALAALLPNAAIADEIPNVMRGMWGVSVKECNETDGPNHNTYFDFKKITTYDSTCLLSGIKASRSGISAKAACEAEGDKYQGTVRISYTPTETIVLELRGPQWGEDGRVLALTRCWRQPKR